jgi:hypothetical protein
VRFFSIGYIEPANNVIMTLIVNKEFNYDASNFEIDVYVQGK